MNGARIGCFSGDSARLFDDIFVLRPTVLSGPPIIWDTLILQFKSMLNAALKNNELQQQNGGAAATPEEIRKRTVQQFSTVLGGRVKSITVGGAPTSTETVQFLRECFDCNVHESYGATEVGGIYSNGLCMNW